MLRQGLLVLLGALIWNASQAAERLMFVSFSMPENYLIETLTDSARLNVPVYLNGLYQDSMSETVKKIMALSQRIPDLAFNIDPTLFERFRINQVPALVVHDEKNFDVIFGHLSIKEALARMEGRGDVSPTRSGA